MSCRSSREACIVNICRSASKPRWCSAAILFGLRLGAPLPHLGLRSCVRLGKRAGFSDTLAALRYFFVWPVSSPCDDPLAQSAVIAAIPGHVSISRLLRQSASQSRGLSSAAPTREELSSKTYRPEQAASSKPVNNRDKKFHERESRVAAQANGRKRIAVFEAARHRRSAGSVLEMDKLAAIEQHRQRWSVAVDEAEATGAPTILVLLRFRGGSRSCFGAGQNQSGRQQAVAVSVFIPMCHVELPV